MYAVQCEELQPPREGWKKFCGEQPVPEVQVASSLEAAAEAAAMAWKDQGNAFFTARCYPEALERWSRALSTLEKYASGSALRVTLYANRAEAQLRLERWEEALLDSEAALAQRPTHEKALLRSAVALRALKRYGEAIQVVQRCLDTDPQHYEAKNLMQDLDQLVEVEQRRSKLSKSNLEGKKTGLQAFEGYSRERESSSDVTPISELPYHKMGLPQEQLELMDNFFKDLRANKKREALSQKKELLEYELVKNEYRERAMEEQALGKPMLEPPVEPKALKEEPSLVITKPKQTVTEVLTEEDRREIDELFSDFPPRSPLERVIQEEDSTKCLKDM